MKRRNVEMDSGMLLAGIFIGFAVAGAIMLFNAPRSGRATRRMIVNAVTPRDAVAESLAEGKAAAHQLAADGALSPQPPERLPDGRQ